MGPFKYGAAYLAFHLNKKIIPVAILGAFEIMPAGKILPRFFSGHRLELRVGSPIDPKTFDSVERLTDHLRRTILQLKG
jgi:1-acyl-sn-glycerol-3-phosphate acyltransferase